MPLSDEELRLLEQMERAITAEDPKFASALRGQGLRRLKQRHVVLSVVALVGGIAIMMTAVVTGLWPLGAVGFLVMVVASALGMESLRGHTQVHSLFGVGDHDSSER